MAERPKAGFLPIARRHALGLLALPLAACAGREPLRVRDDAAAARVDWSAATVIAISLDEYAFAPATLQLRVGQPVRLRFANDGARAHDWTAPGFFRAAAPRPGDALAAAVLAAGGSVDVPAGESREITLVPLVIGTHDVECRRPLHAVLGMHGRVVIVA